MTYISANSLIAAFDRVKNEVQQSQGYLNPAYLPVLQNVDLAYLEHCKALVKWSEDLAKKWLTQWMFAGDSQAATKAENIAKALLNPGQFPVHSQPITSQEAQAMGLKIRFLDPTDPLWLLIWELFCRGNIGVMNNHQLKLFESDTHSLTVPIPAQPGAAFG